jgi:hypothetical protein
LRELTRSTEKPSTLPIARGDLPGLSAVTPPAGGIQSRHNVAVIGYGSLDSSGQEKVKVEIALREPLLTEAVVGEARTLLLDLLSAFPLVPPFPVPCVAYLEAMAQKLRAALSRREPAIRDFFDVDHAVHRLGLPLADDALVDLVRRKLVVTGNARVDVSESRLTALRLQVLTELRLVLRDPDFAAFDLDRAFSLVTALARSLG